MEIVEDGNKEILTSEERYFFYIKSEIDKILIDYGIEYNKIKDDRKTYPKFTKNQFILIITALYNRVYKANSVLLRDDIYISRYDIQKVELCYSVFKMVCNYYSVNYTLELFLMFSGIEKCLLIEWLNLGKSKLYQKINEDSKNIDDLSMLNSDNSLLRVYYRNNKEIERHPEQNNNILPDLITISTPKPSLLDVQGDILQIDQQLPTTENFEKMSKNAQNP